MKKGIALLTLLFLLLSMPFALAEDLAVVEGLDPVWENILLIGTDTRDKNIENGRADVTMVVSVNTKSGAIRLISLARDMWIQLPDSDVHNRINTAYRFGGPDRMKKAVNQTLGLNITKYAAINFYGFCDVIDALGGIEVEMTRAEASTVDNQNTGEYGEKGKRVVHKDGVQTLNGAQALSYARIRKLDNDFGRTQRQRKVVMAVLDKVKTLGILELTDFIKASLSCVSTDLGFLDIMMLAKAAMAGGVSDVKQMGLPKEGSYRYESKDGVSKVIFDADAVKKDAHAFIYGK